MSDPAGRSCRVTGGLCGRGQRFVLCRGTRTSFFLFLGKGAVSSQRSASRDRPPFQNPSDDRGGNRMRWTGWDDGENQNPGRAGRQTRRNHGRWWAVEEADRLFCAGRGKRKNWNRWKTFWTAAPPGSLRRWFISAKYSSPWICWPGYFW